MRNSSPPFMADVDATQPKPAKVAKKKDVDMERRPVEGDDTEHVAVKKEMTATSGPSDGVGKKVKKKKRKKEAVAIAKKKKKKKNKKKKEANLDSSKDKKGGKKEKKVYGLPGQTHLPPSARDPLRVFYETTHKQIPTSEMAAFWMMQRGLLPEDEAKKVYERKLEKSAQQKLGAPIKTVTIKKSGNEIEKETYASDSVPKTAQKKRKSDTSDSDDDFVSSKAVQKADS